LCCSFLSRKRARCPFPPRTPPPLVRFAMFPELSHELRRKCYSLESRFSLLKIRLFSSSFPFQGVSSGPSCAFMNRFPPPRTLCLIVCTGAICPVSWRPFSISPLPPRRFFFSLQKRRTFPLHVFQSWVLKCGPLFFCRSTPARGPKRRSLIGPQNFWSLFPLLSGRNFS